MADLEEDKTTPVTSNTDDTDDQSDDNKVDDTQVEDEAGKAADETTTDDDKTDPEDKKSRGEIRHERYIDKLSDEIKASNAQSGQPTDDLFTPKPYKPLEIKDGGTYDPDQIEADRKALAENKFAEGVQTGINQGTSQVQKELWADRFDIDSDRVTTKYAELDPESDTYSPDLEKYLVQQYIAFTGMEKDARGRVTIQRPNVRFKDFVEAEMGNLDKVAAARNAASSKNVEERRAKTGLRPTGQSRSSSGNHGFDANDPVGSVKRMTSKQYFEGGGKEASDAYLAERGLAPKV